jgi:hypothetical protein
MLVFDHPPAAGVTVAEMLPCVKITWPGALWKLLPLIAMASPTGLVGVVELLMLEIEGEGGGGGVLLPRHHNRGRQLPQELPEQKR